MHIALLTGGISAERPISLRSSEWLRSFIAETQHTCEIFDIPQDIDTFLENYKKFDCVFPYIHGRYGEDGIVSGLCETLGLRYIGSPAITHALCIDKFRTNCVVEKYWIVHVPKSWIPGMTSPKLLWVPEDFEDTSSEEKIPTLIVKPNAGGSSVATNRVTNREELLQGIEDVRINTKELAGANIATLLGNSTHFLRQFPDYSDVPLVQEYIEGEEYTVGVVWPNDDPQVLPIMQIVNLKSVLFNWQEKYESDGSNEVFPRDLEPRLQQRLEDISKRLYFLLGCSGVVRIDYRVRGEEIFFLEINTFPGATSSSFIPKMWRKTGRSMGNFIELLLQTALKRPAQN